MPTATLLRTCSLLTILLLPGCRPISNTTAAEPSALSAMAAPPASRHSTNLILPSELEALRTVPAGAIVEIRYLSASAATPEFGRQHVGGVIAVRTRR